MHYPMSSQYPANVPVDPYHVDYVVPPPQWSSAYRAHLSYPLNFPYNLYHPDYANSGDEYAQNVSTHPGYYVQAPPVRAPVPVPLSTYSSLLPQEHSRLLVPSISSSPISLTPPPEPRSPNIYDSHAPQVLFPTPSELLVNLSSGEFVVPDSPPSDTPSPSNTRDILSDGETAGTLNQRKAQFRAISDAVGFAITDPDTITSHDKKRCYLECLEEYVQWLHEQIRLVGHEPMKLERVPSYRGLSSRSIRTMLVHKQERVAKLNAQQVQEESVFMDLQHQVLALEVASNDINVSDRGARQYTAPEDPRIPTYLSH